MVGFSSFTEGEVLSVSVVTIGSVASEIVAVVVVSSAKAALVNKLELMNKVPNRRGTVVALKKSVLFS